MSGSIGTVPPQGASLGSPYAAEALAVATCDRMGIPFVPSLTRTDAKRWHGPAYSLQQQPYNFLAPAERPAVILVLDDLVSSGTTMRLSLAAIRDAGIPAFGFAFSGH
jgi:adenine/guanine phosphoribosyltransferase-like PRPP-binding protein